MSMTRRGAERLSTETKVFSKSKGAGWEKVDELLRDMSSEAKLRVVV